MMLVRGKKGETGMEALAVQQLCSNRTMYELAHWAALFFSPFGNVPDWLPRGEESRSLDCC